jgi:hypothetical protein
LNSCCKSKKTGEFIFGGNKGFCIFNPEEIKDDELIPPVVLTNFLIFNETVSIGKEVMGELVLKKIHNRGQPAKLIL